MPRLSAYRHGRRALECLDITSALRACDSLTGGSCPLPSDEEEEEEEELTFLGQSFSGSPLVLAQDLVLNALPVVLPIAAFDGYDEVRSPA